MKRINQTFRHVISSKHLSVKQALVTAENVECLLTEARVPKDFDPLSTDIDGNDYWIWRAVRSYSPRCVVIEYNSILPPDIEFTIEYEPNFVWDGTSWYGASLKSLENLRRNKGYRLVGCDFMGVNAFFVREGRRPAVGFLEPFIAENHYEPPRYTYLANRYGHRRSFGRFDRTHLRPSPGC